MSEQFSPFDSAVSRLRNQRDSISAANMQQENAEAIRNHQLDAARERLRECYRSGADYLRQHGIPPVTARSVLPINGGRVGMGVTLPSTKYTEVVFPEGWVIGGYKDGTPTTVLSTNGTLFRLIEVPGKWESAERWQIQEETLERYENFAVDDNGPVLISSPDPYGERPQRRIEEEFADSIAAVILRSGK